MNVILLGTGEAADAKRRLLERAGAVVVSEDKTASLAIVAIEDEAEAKAAIARLKARGILVNAVDRPAFCDFTLPAIVDRDPVLVAIGTGGASAGLAKALRQRFETILPTDLGTLATKLQAMRPTLRARFPGSADRRRAIDALLAPGAPLDPFADSPVTVRAELVEALPFLEQACEEKGIPSTGSGRAEFIELNSQDPDDLTLKQARLLGSADRVYHAPDVPSAILDRARADAVRIAGTAPDTPMPGLTLIVRLA